MSYNRICNCVCSDNPPQCPAVSDDPCVDEYTVTWTIPSTTTHMGKMTGTNCCGFATGAWSHPQKIYHTNCTGYCTWKSSLETPYCTSESDACFPFRDAESPDVSCYNVGGVFSGIDGQSPSDYNQGCGASWLGTDCDCLETSGTCNNDGIFSITRKEPYENYRQVISRLTYCGKCGCSGECPDATCYECQACGHCSDLTDNFGVAYQGSLGVTLKTVMSFHTGRFWMTVYLTGKAIVAYRLWNCQGEGGTMISNFPYCKNFCCQDEYDDDCPKNGDLTNCKSVCESGTGQGEFSYFRWVWKLPTTITDLNCSHLIGITSSTSGVVLTESPDLVTLTSPQDDCALTALSLSSGATALPHGRYFGICLDFTPTWSIGS